MTEAAGPAAGLRLRKKNGGKDMENQFDYQKQPGKSRTRFYAPDPKDALVSVITPFYNAGKFFEQTFNSVMN